MQLFPIMPTTQEDGASAFFSGGGKAPDQGLFAKLVQQASDSGQDLASSLKELKPGANALQKSKTVLGDVNGNTVIPVGDIALSQEDFADLKSALKAYGLTDTDIDELGEKVNNGSYTWGQFLQFLGTKMDLPAADLFQPSFNPQAKRDLQSLFQKLGCTPQEAQKMLRQLDDGKFEKVWEAVSDKLSGLDENAALDIAPGELNTLAKALQLPGEARAKLNSLFQKLNQGEFNSAEAKEAIAFIKKHATEAQEAFDEKGKELTERIQKVLDKALTRSGVMENASNRQGKSTEQLKALIEKTVTEGDEATEADIQKFLDEQQAAKANAAGAQDSPFKGLRAMTNNVREELAAATDKDGVAGKETQEGGTKTLSERIAEMVAEKKVDKDGETTDTDLGDLLEGKDDDGAGTAWHKLIKTITVSAQSAHAVKTDATKAMDAAKTAMQTMRQNTPQSEQILNQVREGMLENLGQGRQRLTLQLEPEDLGKVAVVMQMKGKELTATIRTQSDEVTQAVAEQIAHLKADLEAQGIKVEKLDVQTQLAQQDHRSQTWDGSDRHNQARQMEENSQMLRRLKNLRSIANDVAQEMQNPHATARISHEGLHIIA